MDKRTKINHCTAKTIFCIDESYNVILVNKNGKVFVVLDTELGFESEQVDTIDDGLSYFGVAEPKREEEGYCSLHSYGAEEDLIENLDKQLFKALKSAGYFDVKRGQKHETTN